MRLILGKWCGKKESEGGKELTKLYLNVYDLSPVNNYLYWFGFGIFHSAIEVHGTEYGFGGHDYATSGVFAVEPKSCPGYIFRKSILLGSTDMSHSEFLSFLQNLASKYHGDTYHLIAKNCNHFTEEVCTLITGKSIPGWVNRLARIAASSFCNCLLPEQHQIAGVRQSPDHLSHSDDGSESVTSADREEAADDPDHHLLTSPTSDIVFLQEKPVKSAEN